LEEELVGPSENLTTTRFEKLSMITSRLPDANAVTSSVVKLIQAARENNRDMVYEVLGTMGIGYRPRGGDTGEPEAFNSNQGRVG
ncbi:MAG: hypothetical protein ABSA70_15275, partial [Terriglobia bacterium]